MSLYSSTSGAIGEGVFLLLFFCIFLFSPNNNYGHSSGLIDAEMSFQHLSLAQPHDTVPDRGRKIGAIFISTNFNLFPLIRQKKKNESTKLQFNFRRRRKITKFEIKELRI